jgi:hypothetical protein
MRSRSTALCETMREVPLRVVPPRAGVSDRWGGAKPNGLAPFQRVFSVRATGQATRFAVFET